MWDVVINLLSIRVIKLIDKVYGKFNIYKSYREIYQDKIIVRKFVVYFKNNISEAYKCLYDK